MIQCSKLSKSELAYHLKTKPVSYHEDEVIEDKLDFVELSDKVDSGLDEFIVKRI